MATPKQKYIRQLNSIANRYGKMEDETVKRILTMLKGLRGEIAGTLTRTPTDKFESFRLGQLRAEINNLINQFERKLNSEVSSAIAEAQNHGAQAVVEPLSELGELDEVDAAVQGQFFRPVAAQANVAADYTAALIQNIVEPMRAKINRELQLAVLGRKSPFDVMVAVTNILGVEARAKVWAKRPDPVKGVAARAEADVRTELQRMYNLSHLSQQRQVKQLVPDLLKTWIATADMRTRRSHLVAHLTYRNNPIPVDQPFILTVTKGKNKGRKFKMMYPTDPAGPPELVINCLPGDAPVVASDVVAATRAMYNGPMVELQVGGENLTITPNHPVLTPVGFVPAGLLEKGDYVVCRDLSNGHSSFVPDDVQNVPTSIEQVFAAFSEVGAYFAPARVVDFHSDGRYMDGEVEIVGTTGFLQGDVGDISIGQELGQQKLSVAGFGQSALSSNSFFSQFVKAGLAAPASNISGFDLGLTLVNRHPAPFDHFGLAAPAMLISSFKQETVKSLPAYAKLARQCFSRLAGQVTFSPVTKVRNYNFRGHVYDLQTVKGYYIYNDIIPLSNCRCKLGSVHPRVGVIGSSLDGRIASEVNRRGTRLPPEARASESVVYSCEHGFIIRA